MADKIVKKPITLNDVKVLIDGEIVGYIQKLSVATTVEIDKVWEAGRKGIPIDMVQKKIDINGSFDRQFVDKELLIKLAPMDGSALPRFDLQAQVDQVPARDFLVKDCMLKGFPIELDLDSPSMQSLEYEALAFEWL